MDGFAKNVTAASIGVRRCINMAVFIRCLDRYLVLLVATGRSRPILLKKSVCPNCLIIDW